MKSDNWYTRVRKIFTPLILYLAVSLVVEIVAMVFATFSIQMSHGTSVINDADLFYEYLMEWINKWALVMTGVVAVICLPVLIYMYNKDNKRLVIAQPDISAVGYIVIPLLGIFSSFFLNGLLSITQISELLSEGYEQTAESIYSSALWQQYFIAAVLIPCMEELIFRGIIFRRMRTYAIFSLSALISATLFGIYHMNLLQFIYATCLGIILAYVYEQFRTILAPILLHGFANAFSILLTTNTAIAELIAGNQERLIISLVVSLLGTVAGIFLVNRVTILDVSKNK